MTRQSRAIALMRARCLAVLAQRLALAALVLMACSSGAAAAEITGSVSGLPLPRFVSLKSERVNVRGGPTREHEVAFIFTRAGLPVEIIAEFDNWRRIRDWEGAEGWVFHSLLSGRRTAIVTANPRDKDALLPLRSGAGETNGVVARLQAGVTGTVRKCSEGWCRFVGPGFDGWIEQERLWGVYPGERIE